MTPRDIAMKKIIFLFLTVALISCTTTEPTEIANEGILETPEVVSAKEPEVGYFLYIPDEEEVSDYFNLYNFLKNIDNGDQELTDETLYIIFTNYYQQDFMHSLLLDSYLIQAKNKEIQQKVSDYLSENEIDDSFSKAIIRKYNSKRTQNETESGITYRYNYNDEFYDEDINLFNIYEGYPIDDHLGIMVFDNNWNVFQFNKAESDKSKESKFFVTGGGTNAINMTVSKYSDIDLETFIEEEGTPILAANYENWKITEVPLEGVLSRAGATYMAIGAGSGPDTIPEIDNGITQTLIYNEEMRTGYSITYMMNFSKINNYFDVRYRLWNIILMNQVFTFIEP